MKLSRIPIALWKMSFLSLATIYPLQITFSYLQNNYLFSFLIKKKKSTLQRAFESNAKHRGVTNITEYGHQAFWIFFLFFIISIFILYIHYIPTAVCPPPSSPHTHSLLDPCFSHFPFYKKGAGLPGI